MAPPNVPYLCGGILFDLLLQARKHRQNAREKYDSGSDGLSDPEVMMQFVSIVTGEEPVSPIGNYKKCTSQYKSCQLNSNTYIPFTETSTVAAFDSAIKSKNSDVLKRMSEFVDRFISREKAEWLVKALIEVILNDSDVTESDKFAINRAQMAAPSELRNLTRIELQPFLLSVLHYVIVHRPDNEKGQATFDTWFSRTSDRAEWKFNSSIGQAIAQRITVDYIAISEETPPDDAAETPETGPCSDTKASTEPSKSQVVNNLTIVNQHGKNNTHIDYVETLNL